MGKEDVLQMFGGTFGDEARGIDIGKVPLPAADTLFERPGAGGFAQQIFVVVGFYDNGFAALQFVAHRGCGHSVWNTFTSISLALGWRIMPLRVPELE